MMQIRAMPSARVMRASIGQAATNVKHSYTPYFYAMLPSKCRPYVRTTKLWLALRSAPRIETLRGGFSELRDQLWIEFHGRAFVKLVKMAIAPIGL